jgi:hypothetical protein
MILSFLISFLLIQLSIIFFLGAITKSGRGSLLSIIIILITITNLRFLGLAIYNSLALLGTIIYSPPGQPTQAPDLSIFSMFLPFIILYL